MSVMSVLTRSASWHAVFNQGKSLGTAVAMNRLAVSTTQRSSISSSAPALARVPLIYSPCGEEKNREEKPLVVLIGWLGSHPKNLRRYKTIFHENNMDTLQVHPGWDIVLAPKRGKIIADKLLRELHKPEFVDRPILLHAFSIGAYMWGHVLKHMRNNDDFNTLSNRVYAQVFDSPVNVDNIPVGMSSALFPNNAFVRGMMYHSLKGFINYHPNTNVLREIASEFIDKPLRVPSLFFYSTDDPIAAYQDIDYAIDLWKSYDMNVKSQLWSKSSHVAHMRVYPEEYTSKLKQFIKRNPPSIEGNRDDFATATTEEESPVGTRVLKPVVPTSS
eukprot:Rmarinus@m.14187